MQFLIDTIRTGETIEVDLADVSTCYPIEGKIYFNLVACKLSTARSLEAEAVKEATAIINRLFGEDYCELNKEYPELKEWLEKWGRD